jgi:hypothetical protein
MMTPAILPESNDTAALAPNLNILSPIRELQSPSMLATTSLVSGQTSPGDKVPSAASTTGVAAGTGGDYFTAVKTGKEKEGIAAPIGNEPVTPGAGGLMGRLKNLGKAGKRGAATPGGTASGGVVGVDAAAAGGESEVEEDKDPVRVSSWTSNNRLY